MDIPGINIDTGELRILPVKYILFVTVKKEAIYLHTFTGTYRPIKGLKEYFMAFGLFGFESVDRSTFAQLDKMTRYDRILRIAYFENPDYPTQACFVSEEKGRVL